MGHKNLRHLHDRGSYPGQAQSPYQRRWRNKPDAPKFYDSVQAHIVLMKKNHFDNTAMMLEMYEAERKRQQTAIHNLEDQLTRLANMSLDQSKLREILARAGMDLDVLIKSDDIFGEPAKGGPVLKYCKHGQDMNQSCASCGRP